MSWDFLASDAAIALSGAVVGGGIAVAYDVIKTRRQDRKGDRLVLNLLHTELNDIMSGLVRTRRGLSDELEMTGPDQMLDEPFPPMESALLDLLRLGIPRILRDDKALFDDIRATHHGVRALAVLLDAREAWRRDKALMTGVRAKVVQYDGAVLAKVPGVESCADRAIGSLEAHARAF